ncbi:TRAP transporter small permease [Geminicoccaceae bacterium 1502E]|nr:TRAP transporter small permease [Geminicoccaceae bacterium 1502E]
MTRLLRALDDAVGRLEDIFIAVTMAVLMGLLFANVVFRYVFGSPITWTEEVVVAIFSWMVFVGASAAFRAHLHLRIDLVVRLLQGVVRKVVAALAAAVLVAVIGVVGWFGAAYAQFVAGNLTPMLGFSPAWIYAAVPVGMALSLVHLLRQIIEEGPDKALASVIETAEVES